MGLIVQQGQVVKQAADVPVGRVDEAHDAFLY
jgi:hypothetical protein